MGFFDLELPEFGTVGKAVVLMQRTFPTDAGLQSLTPYWRDENIRTQRPATGYCLAVCEVLYNLMGRTASGFKLMRGEYRSHNWLQHKETGGILDPTKSQFSKPYPYHTGKGVGLRQLSNNAKIFLAAMRKVQANDDAL